MGTPQVHLEEPHKARSILYSSARCLLASVICSCTIVIVDLTIRMVSSKAFQRGKLKSFIKSYRLVGTARRSLISIGSRVDEQSLILAHQPGR